MRKILLCLGIILWAFKVWAVDYTAIDRYAYEAPPLRTKAGLSKLVRHLTSPYQTDTEKARVILAWIVHNIDYDDFKFRAIEDEVDRTKKKDRDLYIPQNDILETRMGVCKDIAQLYKKMLEMAGLSAVVIDGNAGHDMTYEQLKRGEKKHSWNAVKIDRKWEYVDPTWAMDGEGTESLGDISKKKEYKKIIKERKKKSSDVKLPREGRFINDHWFLTDKEEMIKTHFPDEERWQLQKKKLTQAEFLGLKGKDLSLAKREYERSRRNNVR